MVNRVGTHSFNPSTWEAGAGDSDFEAILICRVRPLKKWETGGQEAGGGGVCDTG